MHSKFNIPVGQILWTLNFAAQLVLLVVLLGRDRIRRFPLFTASMVLFAVRLIAEEMLANRIAQLLYEQIMLVLGDFAVILSLLVLVELARRAFVGARRPVFAINAAGLLAVAGGLVAASKPWELLKGLDVSTLLGKLQLMQFVAFKGDMLVALLTIELGLVIVFFGRYFKAGWRSHTQQISIGLSTQAITLLTIQTAVQAIIASAHANPPDQAGYQRLISLMNRIGYANRVVYIAVLLWWIVWLWIDEPGTPKIEEPEISGALAAESAVELETPEE